MAEFGNEYRAIWAAKNKPSPTRGAAVEPKEPRSLGLRRTGMDSGQRRAIAERWTQARMRNLLAKIYGRPQLVRRKRLTYQRELSTYVEGLRCEVSRTPSRPTNLMGHRL